MKIKTCKVCGKKIYCKYPSIAKKRKTCSRQCKGIYEKQQKKKHFSKCVLCGKEFTFSPHVKRGKYCSILCCTTDQKQKRQQEQREKFEKGLLKDRNQIYLQLLERDGNCCSMCGITEWNKKPIRLWVDHIDGDPSNNSSSNFRLICPNCESQTDTSRGKNYGSGRKSRGLKPYS